jgi:hypothetical protein
MFVVGPSLAAYSGWLSSLAAVKNIPIFDISELRSRYTRAILSYNWTVGKLCTLQQVIFSGTSRSSRSSGGVTEPNLVGEWATFSFILYRKFESTSNRGGQRLHKLRSTPSEASGFERQRRPFC